MYDNCPHNAYLELPDKTFFSYFFCVNRQKKTGYIYSIVFLSLIAPHVANYRKLESLGVP